MLSQRGEAAFGAGNHALASACYERVLELHPDDLEARARLAELRAGWARKLRSGGDAAGANAQLAALMGELEPLLATPGALDAARERELIDVYTHAAVATDRTAAAVVLLAGRLDRGDVAAAERDTLVRALDLLATAPLQRLPEAQRQAVAARHDALAAELEPYLYFGNVAARPVETREQEAPVRAAIAKLEALVAEHPSHWLSWWLIGKAYEALGESRPAVEAFAKAHAINPYHPTNAREHVLHLVHIDEPQRALKISEPAVAWFPDDPALLANHALVLLELCRAAQARPFAERAVAASNGQGTHKELLRVIGEVEAGTRPCP